MARARGRSSAPPKERAQPRQRWSCCRCRAPGNVNTEGKRARSRLHQCRPQPYLSVGRDHWRRDDSFVSPAVPFTPSSRRSTRPSGRYGWPSYTAEHVFTEHVLTEHVPTEHVRQIASSRYHRAERGRALVWLMPCTSWSCTSGPACLGLARCKRRRCLACQVIAR